MKRPTTVKIPWPKEITIHMQVAGVLRDHAYPYWVWFHPPNGEWRDKRTAAKLKAMGVKPGVPDFVLIAPDNTVRFLELKRHGEHLSEVQQDFQTICIAHSHPYAVANSLEEALAILTDWGCLRVRL